jgi:hypothetical protein
MTFADGAVYGHIRVLVNKFDNIVTILGLEYFQPNYKLHL